jgi:hypothetical protein
MVGQKIPVQRGVTNVSGGAVANLWGLRFEGRVRGATLLHERRGSSQLSTQHEVAVLCGRAGSLCGLGPSKSGVNSSGGAGVIGAMFQHENLLVQVLDFS